MTAAPHDHTAGDHGLGLPKCLTGHAPVITAERSGGTTPGGTFTGTATATSTSPAASLSATHDVRQVEVTTVMRNGNDVNKTEAQDGPTAE